MTRARRNAVAFLLAVECLLVVANLIEPTVIATIAILYLGASLLLGVIEDK